MDSQRGVALLLTLLMTICVMLIGVSAAQMALEGEKAARAGRDGQVAFQSAEDALNDAEKDIATARAAVFAPDAVLGDGCAPPANGVVERSASGAAPVWQTADLGGEEGGCSVEYGRFTGAEMRTGQGFLPFRRPRYLIERMECHQAGEDAGAAAPPRYCYRVTVLGFGAEPETQAVLQSVYQPKD